MPRRFPLYTDADIHGPVVEAPKRAGWDVVRAVEVFPEGTADLAHFEQAANLRRVFIPNDRRVEAIARNWLIQGKPFQGLITWPRRHYSRMTAREFVEAFEALAAEHSPFVSPIRHIKPMRG